MKKLFILVVVLLCGKISFAQYNFYRLNLGLGLGANTYFGDIDERKIAPTVQLGLDFNITPFSSVGLEIQKGTISAGPDIHYRKFTNSYTAVVLNGTIQLGQLMNIELNNFLYKIRGVYFGTGIGMVMNNQSKIVRIKPDGSNHVFPGVDKGKELMVPSKIGWYFKERSDQWGYTRYVFYVEHQFNVTFGEGLDGYNDPPEIYNNKSPDMYGLITVGVKYTFGPEGIY